MSSLGPRTAGARVPEWVWVPARRTEDGGTRRLELDLRTWQGEVAPVFTSRVALVAALGAAQPWTLVDGDRLRALLAAQGIERVVLDPDAVRSPGPGDPGTPRLLTA